MMVRGNKPSVADVITPGVEGLKNLEQQMETSNAWQPNELGPHYNDKGGRQLTQKEARLKWEKEQRAKQFKDKVAEYRSRREYGKGGRV
jgi:hypothetical protein